MTTDNFQPIFQREVSRENHRALTALVLWIILILTAIIAPERITTKILSAAGAYLVLVGLALHYAPEACHHRAWRRAKKKAAKQ